MTYQSREISVQDAAPVEVYEFARNDVVWRYTSAEQDFAVDSDEYYTTANIRRSAIESNMEQARNALKLTVPRTFPIALLFRDSPPTDVISVTVRRFHRGEQEDIENIAVIWIGRVLGVTFNGPTAELGCEPVSFSLKRQGLRRLYQKPCPHVLYDQSTCKVVKESFAHNTSMIVINGVTVQVASLAALPYAGGFIQYEDEDGNFERRFIRSFSGTTLTINYPFYGIEGSDGTLVTVFPGCDHTTSTCDTVYDNILNYGGFPFFTTKNPFDGSHIY